MPKREPAEHLSTVRDFLRFAVSRFTESRIELGHGTSNALDEAAFLILETLHLPVDDLNPWLEATLLPAERIKLQNIIEARITTRKPAAYLTRRAYIHGVPFYVDERVIVPRSYIGELLFSGLFGGEGHNLIEDNHVIESVLDLCTGSGCLAILAAGIFSNARIDAVDLSADALEVAKINIRDHEMMDRITLHSGNLFGPIAKKKYDLIITNPPYVAEAEVAAFPQEYAHEPIMAHASGKDGLDITRRILAEAPKHLNKGGALLCEIGTGREIIEREYPTLDFFWLDTEESTGEVFWLKF
jgi:ribosomal protein L3 glutamine methyltransferase